MVLCFSWENGGSLGHVLGLIYILDFTLFLIFMLTLSTVSGSLTEPVQWRFFNFPEVQLYCFHLILARLCVVFNDYFYILSTFSVNP